MYSDLADIICQNLTRHHDNDIVIWLFFGGLLSKNNRWVNRKKRKYYVIYMSSLVRDIYVIIMSRRYVGMTGGTLYFRVVNLSVCPSIRHALGVPLCVQRPAKAMPFQQIFRHALQCQHDVDVHLLFCLVLHITISLCAAPPNMAPSGQTK